MCLKRQNLVQQDTFIKLRGLPFSCKTEDIEQFFQGKSPRISRKLWWLVGGRGWFGWQNVRAQHTQVPRNLQIQQPDAFATFLLRRRRRWTKRAAAGEVSRAAFEFVLWLMMGKFVIRLKFQGLEIRNGGNGIYIVYDNRGRPTGEAFVQFSNSEDTDLAMKKNREKIGQRWGKLW
jgi:RNA recognition motif-containing protein